MPANLNNYELVLFDFDGTLADTARDMINALNVLLSAKSMPSADFETLRPYVSNGTPALLQWGFGCSPKDAQFEELRRAFLEIYENNLCVQTVLYPGMDEILKQCEETKVAWGIVTNKPEYMTRLIVEQLGLANRVACIVGGDTLKLRKPDPAPVLHACDCVRVPPAKAVFVGDSWRDIEAGQHAGLTTIGVTYGYIPPDDNPETWGADYLVDSISEIADLLWMNGLESK